MRDWNINIMSYFDNWWTPALPWQPRPKRQGEESRDTIRPHPLIIKKLHFVQKQHAKDYRISGIFRGVKFSRIGQK